MRTGALTMIARPPRKFPYGRRLGIGEGEHDAHRDRQRHADGQPSPLEVHPDGERRDQDDEERYDAVLVERRDVLARRRRR